MTTSRVLRHYLPLALLSGSALVVFLNVSLFDANRYPPPVDIFTEGPEGALPDGEYPPTETSDRPDHGATPSATASTTPADGHTGPPAGGHGGGPASPSTTAPGHAEIVPTDEAHAGDQDTVLRMRRYSTATGYVATALLALTLLIGPANLLLRRANPVSSDLRRDVGISAALASGVHVVFGFLVKHGDGQVLGFFFEPGDRTRLLTNSFGLANWAGLAALVVVVGLAVISNDMALRKLRARRWKRLQRCNYALFALVALHAVLYGALWRVTSPYTVLLAVAVAGAIVAQLIGVRLWRRRRATPAPA